MQVIRNDLLDETLYVMSLENGFRVQVIPKTEFKQMSVVVTVRFGGIDESFVQDGELVSVIPGTAHLLEHLFFRSKLGDGYQLFSALGVSVNAVTTFNRTTFEVTTTQRKQECITLLLDMLQNIQLTEGQVRKEIEIVEKEIYHVRQNLNRIAFYEMRKSLFHSHPFIHDVIGTVENIKNMSASYLERCYRAFYAPDQIEMCIVGDVQPEMVLQIVSQRIVKQRSSRITRQIAEEPVSVRQPMKRLITKAKSRQILIGCKEPLPTGNNKDQDENELITRLMAGIMFNNQSSFLQRSNDNGIVEGRLSFDYFLIHPWAVSVLRGTVSHVDRFLEEYREEIRRIQKYGIEEFSFNIQKQQAIGERIKHFDSPRTLAKLMCSNSPSGNLFETLSFLENLTIEQVMQRIVDHFQWEQMSVCSIDNNELC